MEQNWETPELVILVQGSPDERVLLTGCKGTGQGNTGPGRANNGDCLTGQTSGPELCANCDIQGLS